MRGQRVLLDRDLAKIYGVTTWHLSEAVKRNAARFPEDFMFQLTSEEAEASRSQFAILNHKFTSHDAAIVGILKTIRELMSPSQPVNKRSIGFVELQERKKA